MANNAAYKAWVESHTAEEIADANRARARLQKISPSARKRAPIPDERQPKRPSTAFALYVKARWATGDFAGQPVGVAGKEISREWKSLSASERKVSLQAS